MGAVQAGPAVMHAVEPTWQARWSSLVARIRVVEGAADEHELLHDLANPEQPCVLAFVNAHAMNCVAEDAGFFDAMMETDVLLRDGSGMAQLYRTAGLPAGLNMNGTDFIPKLLAAAGAQGRRVALWGTEEPYLSAAARHAESTWGVNVVSVEHGFHPIEHYPQLAAAVQADLVLLGMGMPKQERAARLVRDASQRPVLLVCGGAIIDFMGGKVSRAPDWMRNLGVEWLYRLFLEPKRLFTRYVVGNPKFLFRVRQWCES